MTIEQKNRIVSLRKAGYGYTAVARELGLTKSAVSTYCHKIGLVGVMEKKDLLLSDDGGKVTKPGLDERISNVTYHFAKETNEDAVSEALRILASTSIRQEGSA